MSKGRVFFSKFMIIFGYFMAIVYVGLGASLFLKQVFPGIPPNLKIAFSLFFIAYGIFRFVKMISKHQENES